jgi:hypothetical protein
MIANQRKDEGLCRMIGFKDILKQTIDEFINNYDLPSPLDINNGYCVEFTESVESKYTDVEVISIDYFLMDGWNGTSNDKWDVEGLATYGLTPAVINFEKLVYHVFLYDGEKFYDSECLVGVGDFLKLPIYQRTLKSVVSSAHN